MAHLEGAYEQVGQRLNSIDMRLASMDARFDAVDRRFNAVDQRFDILDAIIDKRFMWTIAIIVSTWLTTVFAIIAHR